MDSTLNAPVQWAQFGMLAMLIATLASWVAMDVARRVPAVQPRVAMHWLLGAALAMGTGLWSAYMVLASALPSSATAGYSIFGVLVSWLGAMGFSLAGLACAAGRTGGLVRLLAGALILAVGTVATSILAMSAMNVVPQLAWHAARLALAGLAALAGSVVAVLLFFHKRPPKHKRSSSVPLQTLAAVVMGVAVLCSQYLVLTAANPAVQVASAGAVSSTTLAVLASVGSVALLLMMLLGSLIEANLRTALRHATGQLQRHSLTDPLTELPNRLQFEEALAKAVQEADGNQSRFALLLIDLDGFKPINESFGHQGGDRLLREMATRLRSLAGRHDSVARLGADEFLLLLGGNLESDEVAACAARLLEVFGQPCKVEGREASLTCSVGIALYPENGAMSVLLAHADAAKRAAKATGGATYCFFSPHMMSDVREQVELLRDLRRALSEGQFELYYQPKVHAPSGEITGAEALMRWHHPQRGLISPLVFIPIAERFGLIGALGNWVIDEACRQARVWRDEGLRMRVAINLSVHQLRQPDLPDRIEAALKLHQINPQLLTCEITETVAMEDAHGTMRLFERLAAVGVHISIDDFGTGYSSLSYLRKLPAGELKIDSSFVLDLETSSDARAVVDAVVKLAQALGVKVVAEGVETEAQHHILRSLGCNELQGYLFAKPMAAQALSLWAISSVGPRRLDFRPSLFGDTLTQSLG
jgi:diguanylate cyclase (GGDEF)-like protein